MEINEIARRLNITEREVEEALDSAFRKLYTAFDDQDLYNEIERECRQRLSLRNSIPPHLFFKD